MKDSKFNIKKIRLRIKHHFLISNFFLTIYHLCTSMRGSSSYSTIVIVLGVTFSTPCRESLCFVTIESYVKIYYDNGKNWNNLLVFIKMVNTCVLLGLTTCSDSWALWTGKYFIHDIRIWHLWCSTIFGSKRLIKVIPICHLLDLSVV